MKYVISLLALCLLPACMGGGSSDAPAIPTDPTTQLNNEFGTFLNGSRMGTLTYEQRVGSAAQAHASDMFVGDFFAHIDPTAPAPQDGGDRLVAEGYQWQIYYEGIARGEQNMEALLNGWSAGTVNANTSVDDNNSAGFNNAAFEHFGIAKAGTGADQRWVFLMTQPKLP